MLRECAASLWMLPQLGCSALLDFSNSAVPKDAPVDAPYTQAECDYKEPNDSLATAAPITPSDMGPAAICAGAVEDRDFYRFTVPAMTASVAIQMTSVYRPTGDLDLQLFDSTGTPLAASRSFSDTEQIICPSMISSCAALAAGDYIFEVFPAVTGAVNSYTFSVTLTPAAALSSSAH